jgi:hypothetical protein
MLASVMTRPPAPLRARTGEGLPPAVESVVGRCLEKDRVNRFASMSLADRSRVLAADPA